MRKKIDAKELKKIADLIGKKGKDGKPVTLEECQEQIAAKKKQ